MRFRDWRVLPLVLASLCLPATGLTAQPGPDAAYQAKRRQALELFEQGKRPEALPLLEELVKANPKDDAMLVALAACLVDHAAIVTDLEAAAKERLRARDLLDSAWDLGNTSTLAMNLSQLLKKLPTSGAIKFSDNPQVDQEIRAGEAAFSRRDFDEALKSYSKALELDPKSYTAALFIGNSYDRQNQFAKAAEWYEHAEQLDPDVETAYRYHADMLAKEGDMGKARIKLIHAAVAEPYNRMVWRELHAWATLNHTKINLLYISVPALSKTASAAHQQAPDIYWTWQAYGAVKALWQNGGQFKRRFPEEKEYRHSLAEEYEALTAAAKVLDQHKSDEKFAEWLASDPSLILLLKLHQAGLIEPYVLFSLGDAGIARDYDDYRSRNRDRLREYLDKFVVPHTR